jgi:hypothetical protein
MQETVNTPNPADETAPTCKSIAEHCALINEADLSYPIILDSAGRVMDGMHRVCKAFLQGVAALPAVQFARDPEPDHVGKRPDELPYSISTSIV